MTAKLLLCIASSPFNDNAALSSSALIPSESLTPVDLRKFNYLWLIVGPPGTSQMWSRYL